MGSPGSMPAQTVANTFVTKYYNILHQVPEAVYRFYGDGSRLARAEGDRMQTAETLEEIHEMITSLDLKNWKSELFTVDALDSFGGSVFVVVTGAMHRNNCTQKFVQSFILAPQDRGYFVLNDILRYLDESTEPATDMGGHEIYEHEGPRMASDAGIARHQLQLPDQSFLSLPLDFQNGCSCQGVTSVREEPRLLENGRDSDETAAYQMNGGRTSANLRSLEQISLENDTRSFLAEEATAEKKSYAATLLLQRDSPTAQMSYVSHQRISRQPQSGSSHEQFSPILHPPTEERQEPLLVENEVDSRSVYVRNLPPNMVNRQLQDVMKKFGAIRPNSVSVRSNKDGGLYAFVDFEDSSSAQAAIEASPMVVGGQKIYVEGRRSTYLGGRGRGRGQGQGKGMTQSNGSKAGGTGRDYRDGEAGNQGRGSRPVRSYT